MWRIPMDCEHPQLESCRQVNRPGRILFHCRYEPHGRLWDLVRDRLEIVRVELDEFVSGFRYPDPYVRRYAYAHHSDFIRLAAILEHGGVYADMDTLFVNPIPAALFEQPFVLGREDDIVVPGTRERRRSLCNAFIMSEPGAEFGRRWLARMRESFDGSWSGHSTLLPQALSEEFPELIHIEPPRTFYRHMWTPQGIDTLLHGLDRDVRGVLSFHLWSHLWWSRRRRDFSNFHGRMLTEDFVGRVDTTYNVVARRRWWRGRAGGGDTGQSQRPAGGRRERGRRARRPAGPRHGVGHHPDAGPVRHAGGRGLFRCWADPSAERDPGCGRRLGHRLPVCDRSGGGPRPDGPDHPARRQPRRIGRPQRGPGTGNRRRAAVS
jgi:hypothetical protein